MFDRVLNTPLYLAKKDSDIIKDIYNFFIEKKLDIFSRHIDIYKYWLKNNDQIW